MHLRKHKGPVVKLKCPTEIRSPEMRLRAQHMESGLLFFMHAGNNLRRCGSVPTHGAFHLNYAKCPP